MKFFFSLNWSKGLCNLLPWHMSVVVLSWFYMFIFSVTPGPIATKLCRDDFYYFIYKTSSFLLDPANIVATMSTSWFWLNENKKKKKVQITPGQRFLFDSVLKKIMAVMGNSYLQNYQTVSFRSVIQGLMGLGLFSKK